MSNKKGKRLIFTCIAELESHEDLDLLISNALYLIEQGHKKGEVVIRNNPHLHLNYEVEETYRAH